MEQIVYRKTLDVHKNGIQFTLQGFETADKMSRKIEISLMASGDTIDFPLEQIVALMYVTTPNATEPSIHECTIKDNTVIYDVLPIVEEGITLMQLKFVETRVDGANSVLPSPKFAIEVAESSTNDDGAIQSTTFTALEDAIAKSQGVYDARLLRIELDSGCMFRAIYADGTVYETDALRETLLKGEALLSQSYARGGTGLRVGEDTDNSKYYSNVSKGASEEANKDREEANKILQETRKHGVYTSFSVDFETGEVKYISPCYSFSINKENGNLEASGMTYTPDDTISKVVNEWLSAKTLEIASLEEKADGNASGISLLWDEARSLSTSISTLNMTKAPMTHYHDSDSFVDTWSIEKGGTGATTVADALENLGVDANGLFYADNVFPNCLYKMVNGVREWLNPPMISGVAYRTTKRFKGKAVYAFLVDIPQFPNNAAIELTIPNGNVNARMTNVVNLQVYCGKSSASFQEFPMFSINDGKILGMAYLKGTGEYTIVIKSFSDLSGYTGRMFIEYTID
jgi:hypothetical protein